MDDNEQVTWESIERRFNELKAKREQYIKSAPDWAKDATIKVSLGTLLYMAIIGNITAESLARYFSDLGSTIEYSEYVPYGMALSLKNRTSTILRWF